MQVLNTLSALPESATYDVVVIGTGGAGLVFGYLAARHAALRARAAARAQGKHRSSHA